MLVIYASPLNCALVDFTVGPGDEAKFYFLFFSLPLLFTVFFSLFLDLYSDVFWTPAMMFSFFYCVLIYYVLLVNQ